jgi:hypothetical protein
MDANNPRFSYVNWDPLLEDLLDYAKGLFRQEKCDGEESILPGTGKSAKDLVFDAATEFIVKQVEWRPSSPENATKELFYLLRTVIKHDFLDLVRDGRAYKRTEIIGAGNADRDGGSGPEDEPADEDGWLEGLIDKMSDEAVEQRAYAAVEGKPELKEYLDAVLCEGYTKRKKVADHLGINLQEAERRRGKLKTRLTPLKRALEAGRASKSHRA